MSKWISLKVARTTTLMQWWTTIIWGNGVQAKIEIRAKQSLTEQHSPWRWRAAPPGASALHLRAGRVPQADVWARREADDRRQRQHGKEVGAPTQVQCSPVIRSTFFRRKNYHMSGWPYIWVTNSIRIDWDQAKIDLPSLSPSGPSWCSSATGAGGRWSRLVAAVSNRNRKIRRIRCYMLETIMCPQ